MPAPFLIFLSYPACFLYGRRNGVAGPVVWREKRPSAWAAYALLTAAVGGSFLLLLVGPIRAQHDTAIVGCWTNAFPDWGRPGPFPAGRCFPHWILSYCCKPLGHALAPAALLGAVVLWRRGRPGLVVLLAAPVLLALAASFAGRYPYGGARILVYAAPAIVLFVAAATPHAWDWLSRRHQPRTGRAGLAVPAAAGCGGSCRRRPLAAGGHGRGRRLRRGPPASGGCGRGQRLDASVLLPPARHLVPAGAGRRACGGSMLDRLHG